MSIDSGILPVLGRFLIIIFVLFFPLLYFFRLRSLPTYNIPEKSNIRVRGRISKIPYLKGSYQIISIGPVTVRTMRFPTYYYHQKIEIIGKLEKQVTNRFQVGYWANFPEIRVIDQGISKEKKNHLISLLSGVRKRLEEVIGQLLPEPHSSLLVGIILGVKSQMPQGFWQKLQETGTLHIVVASGQNIAILVWVLVEGLVWIVNRQKALVIALAVMLVYVLLVGAEAPIVRAGIMAGLSCLAQLWGREAQATLGLLIAAGLMLLLWPLLLFDLGFQLSFAASAGIIWLYPLLRGKRFAAPAEIMDTGARKVKPHKILQVYQACQILFLRPFGEVLATTLAAQLAVMPIILINFGQVSLLSPLVNGLVLWVVPLVMIMGMAMVGLGLIVRPLAQVLSWFVWLLLSYFIEIIEAFGRLPWASVNPGKLSAWWAMGYYLVLALVVARYKVREVENCS